MQRIRFEGDSNIIAQTDGHNNSVTISAGSCKLTLDQPHKRRRTKVPSSEREILLTELRATDLVGRRDDLAKLDDWRASEKPVAVRCIIGRAGSGKTRLAITACMRAESNGWIAGFVEGRELQRFHHAQNLEHWRSPTSTLVVIDDAASSVAILREWLGVLARQSGVWGEKKLRILLLERHADAESRYGWWAEFTRCDSLVKACAGDLVGGERPVPLTSLPKVQDRRRLLAQAVKLAAAVLEKPAIDLPPKGLDPDFDRRLAGDRLENEPLYLLMAGIVAVDRQALGVLSLGRIELAKQVAQIERSRLIRICEGRGFERDSDFVAHLAACITVQQGCDFHSAISLVREEIAAEDYASHRPQLLVDLLAEALPSTLPDRIDPVRPDLIGQAFLIEELFRSRTRLEEMRFAVVARAYRRAGANVIDTLVKAAQDLAAGAEDHPSVRWLAQLAATASSLDDLLQISTAIPEQTLALRKLAVEVDQRIVEILTSPESIRGLDRWRLLAEALHNLSFRMGELGRTAEALAAGRQGADLFRMLTAWNAGAYAPYLARSISSLSVSLVALGHHQEAAQIAEESVALYRKLAKARPDVFAENFATSLNHFSVCLMSLDRLDEALSVTQEAVALCRAKIPTQPEIFKPILAITLMSASTCLLQGGQGEEAAAASQQAVELCREVAARLPDAHTLGLTHALINLSSCLSAVDRHQEALAAAQEAVDLCRAMVAGQTDTFTLDLAQSLYRLSICLDMLGCRPQALAAGLEAASLYRLAAKYSSTQDLATLLAILSMWLDAEGRSKEALAALLEAAQLYRGLAAQQPNAFVSDLARSLAIIGHLYERDGDLEAAIASSREAIAELAPSFLANPAAFGESVLFYCIDYIWRCEILGEAPDEELLGPVRQTLATLLREGDMQVDPDVPVELLNLSRSSGP